MTVSSPQPRAFYHATAADRIKGTAAERRDVRPLIRCTNSGGGPEENGESAALPQMKADGKEGGRRCLMRAID
jgi:hypothetical protein